MPAPEFVKKKFFEIINNVNSSDLKRTIILTSADDKYLVTLFLHLFSDNFHKEQDDFLNERVNGKKSLLVIQRDVEEEEGLFKKLCGLQEDGFVDIITTKDIQKIMKNLKIENPHEGLVKFIKSKDYAYVLFMPASVTFTDGEEYYQDHPLYNAFDDLLTKLLDLKHVPTYLLVEKYPLPAKPEQFNDLVKNELFKKIAEKG